MIYIKTQDRLHVYRIYYYHLDEDKDNNVFKIMGFDFETKELVELGRYNFYKQAINVFAEIDYKENDLMYFKHTTKRYVMPKNITNPQVCISKYGSLY